MGLSPGSSGHRSHWLHQSWKCYTDVCATGVSSTQKVRATWGHYKSGGWRSWEWECIWGAHPQWASHALLPGILAYKKWSQPESLTPKKLWGSSPPCPVAVGVCHCLRSVSRKWVGRGTENSRNEVGEFRRRRMASAGRARASRSGRKWREMYVPDAGGRGHRGRRNRWRPASVLQYERVKQRKTAAERQSM